MVVCLFALVLARFHFEISKLQSDMLIYVPCPIHAKSRQHLGAVHVQAPAAVRNLAAPSKVAMLRIESAGRTTVHVSMRALG